MKTGEQFGSSNGGQRPSLNSGFLPRRGWPISFCEKTQELLPRLPVHSLMKLQFTLCAVALLAGLLVVPGQVRAEQNAFKNGKKHKSIDVRALLEEGKASGALPAGVSVRIHANLATSMPADVKLRSAAEARGVDFSKKLEELWEFTADHVHRVVMDEPPNKIGEKFEYVYRRVESRPFDSKGLCKELLDGKALEIQAAKGKGMPLQFVGTHYNVGGRSIKVLCNGETVLYIGEHCTSAGYAESDARAFAALYERLAGQARLLFKSKADEAK